MLYISGGKKCLRPRDKDSLRKTWNGGKFGSKTARDKVPVLLVINPMTLINILIYKIVIMISTS